MRAGFRRDRNSHLDQILHALEPHRLAAVEWLAIADTNRLSPIGRLMAKLIEKCGRLGGPPFDELALIAANRRQLFVPVGADVEHKRRLTGLLQVDAVVVEYSLWMPRFARHVGFRQL